MRLRARSALTGLVGPVSLIARSPRTDNLRLSDKFRPSAVARIDPWTSSRLSRAVQRCFQLGQLGPKALLQFRGSLCRLLNLWPEISLPGSRPPEESAAVQEGNDGLVDGLGQLLRHELASVGHSVS